MTVTPWSTIMAVRFTEYDYGCHGHASANNLRGFIVRKYSGLHDHVIRGPGIEVYEYIYIYEGGGKRTRSN